ncbi:MAG: tRNA pseudouridine(38-40) synthase TruA [Gemmiger sp.]
MNVLVTLSFKGTNYVGFQVQPNGLSVCEAFQNALQRVLGARPDVKGCSRTDAGVHALGFCLNFHYDGRVPPQKLAGALNAHLPPDIRVRSVRPVEEDFHARYSAHLKTYRYRIRNSRTDSPFDADLCYRLAGPLDLDAMRRAAAGFAGTHDFLALCASGSSVAARGDTVRTITECTVERQGEVIAITVTADGYLYNMVRILAGTLVAAGQGRFDPDAVPALLQSRDRKNAGPTLPAKGLFLVRVEYGLPPE